jgi:serine protease
VQSFVQGLQGSSYLNIISQYYSTTQGYIQSSGAEYGGAFWDDGSTPNSPSQDQVATEALTGLHVFGDESQDANYIVLTPTGHSAPGSFSSFCGYHAYKTYAPGSSLIFSYIPYIPDGGSACAGPLTGASMVVGHEIAEAQTDPLPNSGWTDQSDPNDLEEVGDKCAWLQSNVSLSTGTFPVQSLWSNADMAANGGNGCVYSYTASGPAKTCTTDSYGYCIQATGSSYHNQTCLGDPYQVGYTTYALFQGSTYKGSYTDTTTLMVKYCVTSDRWTPVDPKTDVGDPNLP